MDHPPYPLPAALGAEFAAVLGVALAVAVAVALVSIGGCARVPRYYTAEYSFKVAAEHRNPQAWSPQPDARDLIRRAETVAFLPPDRCRDVKAAPTGSQEIAEYLRLSCGPLMAELEREASKLAYKVVSWQTLRGSRPPIDYARDQGVHLLFEINELAASFSPTDLYEVADVSFYEEHEQRAARSPLVVNDLPTVAGRCHAKLRSKPPQALTTTLDVKMVRVKTGEVAWYYRKTHGNMQSVVGQSTNTYEAKPDETSAAAIVGLSVGIPLTVAAFVLTVVGVNEVAPWLWLSGLPLTCLGGIGAGAVGYPAPEEVICEQPPVSRRPRSASAGTSDQTTPTQSGSGFTFTRSQSAPNTDLLRALMHEAVFDFMTQLRAQKQAKQ